MAIPEPPHAFFIITLLTIYSVCCFYFMDLYVNGSQRKKFFNRKPKGKQRNE